MSTVALRSESGLVTLDSLDNLLAWVIQAPPEEVCWRITEIGSAREWLTAQKAATELRIRAVRLELIALRKVAAEGLKAKIAGDALRNAAEWLGLLNEEQFGELLAELDGKKTPIALYRASLDWRRVPWEVLEKSPVRGPDPLEVSEKARELHDAAETILSDLVANGEPFTVSMAAEELADRLGMDAGLARATTEGMREMIRGVIRRSSQIDGYDNVLPWVLTVLHADGRYVRVPRENATIGDLQAHVQEVTNRARLAQAAATRLNELFDSVLARTPDGDATEETLALPLRRYLTREDLRPAP